MIAIFKPSDAVKLLLRGAEEAVDSRIYSSVRYREINVVAPPSLITLLLAKVTLKIHFRYTPHHLIKVLLLFEIPIMEKATFCYESSITIMLNTLE